MRENLVIDKGHSRRAGGIQQRGPNAGAKTTKAARIGGAGKDHATQNGLNRAASQLKKELARRVCRERFITAQAAQVVGELGGQTTRRSGSAASASGVPAGEPFHLSKQVRKAPGFT